MALPDLRRGARLLAVSLSLALVAACASVPRTPYTEAEADKAVVPGFEVVRTWADEPGPGFVNELRKSRAASNRSGRGPVYLAISGGGGDGAFGAGVLKGWSESGQRPEFGIVSGVSTGALIAPFAYLGPRYDGQIEELYTSGLAETLLESPNPINAIFGSAIFSNDRLRDLASRYITADLLAEVARERARGRLLLVVTANLDSQRPVLWDMGAIAREGTPEALERFRDVLVASASIPAVFPPVLIDAVADGHRFQEMHSDGTVLASVFTLPRSFFEERSAIDVVKGSSLFVIMNAKLGPDFTVLANRTTDIVGRTFSTFVKNSADAVLYDTEEFSRRRGINFRITAIDDDRPTSTGAGFDTQSMRSLFQHGYEKAKGGRLWRTTAQARSEARAR